VTTYARWLFGTAAALNIGVAAGLLFLRPQIGPLLGLDPISGTNVALLYLTAGFIGLFGYAYVRVAMNPAANRPLISLSVIGKLTAVGWLVLAWLTGDAPGRLVAPSGADLIYTLLFLDFLRRTRPSQRDTGD
jgi:hypothetical protein